MMKVIKINLCTAILLLVLAGRDEGVASTVPHGVEAASPPLSAIAPEGVTIVARHAIDLGAPAGGPTTRMASGPLLGNGDVGVMQSGSAERLTFFIGKNDFWGVRTRGPMTVGRVCVLTPVLKGARFKTTEDLQLAEIRGEYTVTNGTALASSAWVDANRNLFCVELANTGSKPLAVSLETLKGGKGEKIGGDFEYAPDPESPQGRKIGVSTRVIGRPDATPFSLAPGEKATVATVILSDLDTQGKAPLAEAQALAGTLTAGKIKEVSAAHRAWWKAYWGRSFIEISDKTLEQFWYSAWYVIGSCSRAGKVAPGLWGNWITVDNPGWYGDWHLNYNFQAPFYGLYSANHADTTLPFYDAMNQGIPAGRSMAKKRGWKGICFPVGLGPDGMLPWGEQDWGQRSNAAYSALLYGWYWQAMRDTTWLRKTGYPYMREVAAFWEDYLKLERGPSGKMRYVIHNDSTHEGSGNNINPILSLGLVRALFKNMVSMSEALGVEADKRAKWRDILEKVSDFPRQTTKDGRTIFRYSEQGLAWFPSNTLGIQHIFPAGAIGLDSDPKLLETSHNMIDAMGRWIDGCGSSSWYTACVRVGYKPETVLANLRHLYARHVLPNKLMLGFKGGGIENVSPSLAVTEMLMQSHEGILRFFPCWPATMDARFGGLRANGAFLVWAQLKGGTISGVKITSEQGCDCAILNPWPGKRVRVNRDGKIAESVTGARFTLKTGRGETLELYDEK